MEAGGIGVTPFIAMMRAFSTISAQSVTLFYSVNKPTEMIHKDAFVALTQEDARFQFHGFIAGGEHGYLSGSYILDQVKDFNGTMFFICGPPGMMKSIKKQLVELGVPKRFIVSEEFSLQ